jgi:type IX secretion system PorP/SprF family membrane protein
VPVNREYFNLALKYDVKNKDMDKVNVFFFKIFKILPLVLAFIASFNTVTAQQTPLTPISNRVFTPFIINPAIAGSKDFMAIDISAVIQGTDKSQLLSGNTRIAKKGPTYFGAPVSRSYTQFGVGAAFFNDVVGPSRNLGFTAAASYHKPLDDKNLSFLSGGIAVKGIYNMMDSIPDTESPPRNSFIPNLDAGLYYYGKSLYAGISATNILGNMLDSSDMAAYNVPLSREYFLITGYKFVISKSLNIVIEPSLIIDLNDSLNFDNKETYNPMLKLYLEDFCFGGYLHDYDKLTFFFQYKFPRLYLGTLVDFPRDVPFYKEDLVIEIAAGVNFGSISSSSSTKWHW